MQGGLENLQNCSDVSRRAAAWHGTGRECTHSGAPGGGPGEVCIASGSLVRSGKGVKSRSGPGWCSDWTLRHLGVEPGGSRRFEGGGSWVRHRPAEFEVAVGCAPGAACPVV